MTHAEIVIVSAKRTAIGAFLGGFARVPAHDLGAAVLRANLEHTGVTPEEIYEVILGQVLSAGAGQNPARQASMKADLPESVPAWGINQVCGSGLRSIALAYQSVLEGAQARESRIILAGGQENMSLSPHLSHLRAGVKMGPASLTDSMLSEGLTDAFSGQHMGVTAENVAKKYGISREEQDAFAAHSQQKAEEAQKSNAFDAEIVPFTVPSRKGDVVVDADEFPRHGTTADSLAKLRPAFDKEGSVTAGNASGINDGAAAMMVMTLDEAKKRGLKPMARIVSWAQAGVSPDIMGTGPIPASGKALERAGWSVKDLDLIEANEAFAAQAIAVNRDMGWDTEKVNVNGGAIALGHPIGASGARVMVTLLHAMQQQQAQKGLATLCIGGGMGVAMCIEALH